MLFVQSINSDMKKSSIGETSLYIATQNAKLDVSNMLHNGRKLLFPMSEPAGLHWMDNHFTSAKYTWFDRKQLTMFYATFV